MSRRPTGRRVWSSIRASSKCGRRTAPAENTERLKPAATRACMHALVAAGFSRSVFSAGASFVARGEREPEGAARAERAFHADLTAVRFHGQLTKGQAQAGRHLARLFAAFDLAELFE